MLEWIANAFMTFGLMQMTVSVYWAIFFFPFFYLWLIPFFICCIWAYLKKKSRKFVVISFVVNIIASWLIVMVMIMNTHF